MHTRRDGFVGTGDAYGWKRRVDEKDVSGRNIA
jgi:hypothetical protein